MHEQRTASLRWGPRFLRDLVNAPDLATAAAHLASAGVPVFPCVPGGKRPLTVHGFQDASIDPGIVTAWWDRRPDANIGVPTGVLGGIDVVDVTFTRAVLGSPRSTRPCVLGSSRLGLPGAHTAGGLHAAPAPTSLAQQPTNGASVPESVGSGSQLARHEGRCVIPRRSSNRGLEATLTLRTESNALGKSPGADWDLQTWSVNPQDVRSGFRRSEGVAGCDTSCYAVV